MINKCLMFAGLVVAALLPAIPSSASDADLLAEINPAYQSLRRAFVDHDGSVIKQYMTADGLLVTPFYGGALTTDQIAESLGRFDIERHDSHQLKVTPVGSDAALMTLYTSFTGTYDGKPLPAWVFASGLWVRQEDGWRLKLYQETAVDAPN